MDIKTIIGLTGTLLILYYEFVWKKRGKKKRDKITGDQLVKDLDNLGYFTYILPDDINKVKQVVATYFDEKHYFLTDLDDYRMYVIDAEGLFEGDGLVHNLGVIKSTFDKIGIPLTWSDEKVKTDGNSYLHTIHLNGTEYTAFDGDMSKSNAWGQALVHFMDMLNDQLQKGGSDERIYPMWGHNEECIIFLTPPQFDYLSSVRMERDSGPMPLAEWRKKMK